MTDKLTPKQEVTGGRPSFEWTEGHRREIMDRLMDGDTLTLICGPSRPEGFPSERTFYKRLANDEGFAQEYARAREVQAHREADEIRKIADEATAETYQQARLRIDARKWRASKMAPKKYGDKLDLTSEDGSMTPKGLDVSGLSTEALKEIMDASNGE